LAEQYENKLKNEIAEKKIFSEQFPSTVKFNEFLPDYLKKNAVKKRSCRDYVSITKKLLAFFGDTYPHKITRYQIESYYSTRER